MIAAAALIVVTVTYLILAITLVMVSQPIDGALYLVNRVGVTGGAASPGTALLMDLDNEGATWTARWNSTIWHIRRPVVVEVISPASLESDYRRVVETVNPTTPRSWQLPSSAQREIYVVKCRAGACQPGSILVVPVANTVGTIEVALAF